MNEQLQEQIKVVAIYDGWAESQRSITPAPNYYTRATKQGNEYKIIGAMKYHTSFDALMPVAYKVKEEIFKNNREDNYPINFAVPIIDALVKGDISKLFASVVSAIQFLNTLKEKS